MTHYVRSAVRSRTAAGWPHIAIGVEGEPPTILVLYGRTNEEQVAAEREAALVVKALNGNQELVHAAYLLLRTLGYDHNAPLGDKPVDRIINPDFPTTAVAAARVLSALKS